MAFGAGMFLGDPKIQANRFRMTEMKVTVRLGRKTRDRGLMFPRGKVFGDDVSDEIGFGSFGHGWKLEVNLKWKNEPLMITDEH